MLLTLPVLKTFGSKMNKHVLVSLIFKHLSGMQILLMLGKPCHGTYLITGVRRGTIHAKFMSFLSACICQNGVDK